MASSNPRVLISGAGIAGLTLGICLKRHGFDTVIVEREPAMRAEGYMMDFFGTGWDVAERLDLVDELRAIRYPIDFMEYVDDHGATWLRVDIERIRKALNDKYVYLRRSDLERILHSRAGAAGLAIRFGTTVEAIGDEEDGAVAVTLSDGTTDRYGLVFGADGFHSRVRELAFGPEAQFARFLGYYLAAFHFPDKDYGIGRALKLHETTDRVCGFYPLGGNRMDATYTFRHPDVGHVPHGERLPLLKQTFAGSGWIAEQVLNDVTTGEAVYFDSVTQIVMPRWSKGRVALVGDACGCLTLLAGQGSHMAMAGGYVVANELARNPTDHAAAFDAYERLLRPAVEAKQRSAARFSKSFVPSASSSQWVRRLTMRLMFASPFLGLFFRYFGSKSVLAGHSWRARSG
jgi:2-polyprenyl-6-methoxyphenol hydroxylase-like FAD-dependent oxidoreductase